MIDRLRYELDETHARLQHAEEAAMNAPHGGPNPEAFERMRYDVGEAQARLADESRRADAAEAQLRRRDLQTPDGPDGKLRDELRIAKMQVAALTEDIRKLDGEREKASATAIDDLWLIARTPDALHQQPLFARSMWHGIGSNGMLELSVVQPSPAVPLRSGVKCVALRGPNAADLLAQLDMLNNLMLPRSPPILHHLLSPSTSPPMPPSRLPTRIHPTFRRSLPRPSHASVSIQSRRPCCVRWPLGCRGEPPPPPRRLPRHPSSSSTASLVRARAIYSYASSPSYSVLSLARHVMANRSKSYLRR